MRIQKYCIITILLALLMSACALSKQPAPSDLQARETREDGFSRTDYIDADGTLTNHPEKGYATVLRTEDGAGHVLLEQYLNAGGHPARLKAGYCTIARQYNDLGQCVRIEYQDCKGQPVNTQSGYAVITRAYDSAGRIESQFYLDRSGNPVRDWTGTYGFRRAYNDAGQVSAILYLDARGNPCPTDMGYASVRRTYRDGSIHTERYFAADGTPAASDLGQFGVQYGYDASGHITERTYLGADGRITALSRGYSILRTAYDESGAKTSDAYFDAEGNPAMVQGRYHRIVYRDGREHYYDAAGNSLFLPDIFLRANFAVVVCAGIALCALAILLPPACRAILLGLYLAFIGYMTFMNRESGDPRSRLELFWSYRRFFQNSATRTEILNNILLFVPFGALMRSLSRNRRRLWIIPLLSVGIELTQYVTGLGLCELDDILNNTLGGLAGYLLIGAVRKYKKTN